MTKRYKLPRAKHKHKCHHQDLSMHKDLCYVKLRRGKCKSSCCFGDNVIDFDKKNNVIGVEFLDRL